MDGCKLILQKIYLFIIFNNLTFYLLKIVDKSNTQSKTWDKNSIMSQVHSV